MTVPGVRYLYGSGVRVVTGSTSEVGLARSRQYRRGLPQIAFLPVLFTFALLWLAWIVARFGAAGIRGDLAPGGWLVFSFFIVFGVGFAALCAWPRCLGFHTAFACG